MGKFCCVELSYILANQRYKLKGFTPLSSFRALKYRMPFVQDIDQSSSAETLIGQADYLLSPNNIADSSRPPANLINVVVL